MIHINKMKSTKPFREWIDYPATLKTDDIKKYVAKISSENQIMIVIGTGGSYMGTKAALDMLMLPNQERVYFVGPSTDTRYLNYLLSLCIQHDVIVNVISKSGSTLEIMMYFEIFEKFLKEKYKESWYRHICCTTSNSGKLYDLAIMNNYKLFYLPNNIGGRFSVISAVGLLPMAFAGIDIDQIIEGSLKARLDTQSINNEAYKYALIRNTLYNKGYKVEMFVSYFSYFNSFTEWLKQLFGESEGKERKGILPCSLEYPKDLHSLGQYMQEGERFLFETQFNIKNPHQMPNQYIEECKFHKLREAIVYGTAKAHNEGSVPVLVFDIETLDEVNVGYMFYFFEIACTMSAYLLGVNPFNQPGVEQYKKNMKNILN